MSLSPVQQNSPYTVVVYGEENAGKRELINSMAGKTYNISNKGIDFVSHWCQIDGKDVQIRFAHVHFFNDGNYNGENVVFRNAHAVLHCFDIANEGDLAGLKAQLTNTEGYLYGRTVTYVVGTNSDKAPTQVTDETVQNLINGKPVTYVKAGENVKNQEFFTSLVREMIKKEAEANAEAALHIHNDPFGPYGDNISVLPLSESHKKSISRQRVKINGYAFGGFVFLAAAGVLFALGANAIRSRLGIHGYWLGALALVGSVGLFALSMKSRRQTVDVHHYQSM